MAAGMVSTPFPMAPSLDTTGDLPVSSVQTSSSSGAALAPGLAARNDTATCETSNDCWGSMDRQAILGEVRSMVLEEVDEKLADKMKDLWLKGNKMIKSIETESHQQTATLLEQLSQSTQRQEGLKAEQEHLRTLLTSMVQQLSMLGAAYGAPSVPDPFPASPSTPAMTACDASTASTTAASTSLQDFPPGLVEPPGLAEPAFVGGCLTPLPAMPDFPFPLTSADASPLPATPLSLVEALGSEATPGMGSLSPTMAAEMDFGKVFSFTLRKAEGTDLGINVSHHEHDKMLRVEGVRPEGAVEAWNRQCMGSAASEKAVFAGDRIVSVNGVINEPAKMLEECRDKQLLKFTIMRGGAPLLQAPPSTPAVTPSATTTLRADACEFVPGGLITEQPMEAKLCEDAGPQDAEVA